MFFLGCELYLRFKEGRKGGRERGRQEAYCGRIAENEANPALVGEIQPL